MSSDYLKKSFVGTFHSCHKLSFFRKITDFTSHITLYDAVLFYAEMIHSHGPFYVVFIIVAGYMDVIGVVGIGTVADSLPAPMQRKAYHVRRNSQYL